MSTTTVALICPRHGYTLGASCPRCEGGVKGEEVRVNTENWVQGWYEHIDKTPIYIESKKQLKEECEKRGLMARSLMKPKSQGKGYEMR